MVNLLVDRTVMARFLVDTLEWREPVSADAMFCIGESNDAWQQTAKKLLDKYTVEAIDSEGWMVCRPKPENSVEFFELTLEMIQAAVKVPGGDDTVYLRGQWGQTVAGKKFLQRAVLGDRVARNREDIEDQWVVRRSIWNNSYIELS